MKYLKKDLATSLTSLIFVVISLTGVVTVYSGSSYGDPHQKFDKNKTVMNTSLDDPFIVLGNNIAIVKQNTKKDNLG